MWGVNLTPSSIFQEINQSGGLSISLLSIFYKLIEAETKWPPFRRRHFQTIFSEWKCLISIKISLKFVPKAPINNIPSLGQIMVWRRPGDKTFSEPMMVSLLTHICITGPQWVNGLTECNRTFHRWSLFSWSSLQEFCWNKEHNKSIWKACTCQALIGPQSKHDIHQRSLERQAMIWTLQVSKFLKVIEHGLLYFMASFNTDPL